MRVLLNGLQAGNRSGTGRYTMELARRLPGLANDVEVSIFWPSDIAAPAPIHSVKTPFVIGNAGTATARIWLDQVGICRIARDTGAELLHFPANIGLLHRKARSVLTIHDLSFFRNPDWYRFERAAYYRFAVKRSARMASRLIADSAATARDLREFLNVPDDRIDVVPLGVDESFRPAVDEDKERVRRKYSLPPRFFLFIGTLEPRKNLVRLIEAWTRISADCDQDLVLAGRRGWKVEPILEAISRSSTKQRIHLPDFVAQEDLPALLSTASTFVWPSLWEGFGLPPLEAMACGTPVITSNTSSLPEVVGAAALKVDPEDVHALADAMKRLAVDPALRAQLSAAGLKRAAEFTWEQTARLTLDAYQKA